jgi:hypothetical protein
MAQRYQDGHLRRAKRKRGADVWEFLWRECGPDGKRRQRTLTVGTVTDFVPSGRLKPHSDRADEHQSRFSKIGINDV